MFRMILVLAAAVITAVLTWTVIYSINPFSDSYFSSSTETPAYFPPLILCKEKRPNFFHPFRKVEYSYRVGVSNTCSVVERAESRLTSDLVPIQDDVMNYWGGYEEDGFVRDFVPNDFANYRLYILQYILIIALGINLVLIRYETK